MPTDDNRAQVSWEKEGKRLDVLLVFVLLLRLHTAHTPSQGSDYSDSAPFRLHFTRPMDSPSSNNIHKSLDCTRLSATKTIFSSL